MTSKSLFSKLLREDLKRRTWAIALAMIGFFFALPINLALTMENAQADNFYRYNNYESLDAVQWSSPEQKAARYVLVCTRCGAEFIRARATSVVLHPERYRCRCGGQLALKQGDK